MRRGASGIVTARKQLRNLLEDGMPLLDAANVIRDRLIYGGDTEYEEPGDVPRVPVRRGGRPNEKQRRCRCGCNQPRKGRQWYASEACRSRYRTARMKERIAVSSAGMNLE